MPSLSRPSLFKRSVFCESIILAFCFIFCLPGLNAQVTSSQYWTLAEDTHDFVVGNLLTSYNSYEIEPGSGTAYAWYTGSQIDADGIMLQEGDSRYSSYMNNAYEWMGNLWDSSSPAGGYYAAANVNGSGAGGDQYVDDNSLIGLAYLDAYAVTTGSQQAAYLASAEAIANWLMQSGQWDSTFGGGFWWSTQKTVKPTQSNGLALQLFLRLYQITGQSYYESWAESIDSWLESTMYNTSDGLYNWEIESNGTLETTQFTYDNSIMIEAFILYSQILQNPSYLTKAESLANSLNTVLWNSSYQVYAFNTGSATVNPTWCGWASEALIRLYQADGNTTWLSYAQENIDFMNTYLRNASTYGYYSSSNIDGSDASSTYQGVDQAWMQKIQALMALYK
jgi:uncharacterized protein YyaL (SSP411 family)